MAWIVYLIVSLFLLILPLFSKRLRDKIKAGNEEDVAANLLHHDEGTTGWLCIVLGWPFLAIFCLIFGFFYAGDWLAGLYCRLIGQPRTTSKDMWRREYEKACEIPDELRPRKRD